MELIKNLFENINENTLPSGIYNRLAMLDTQRSFSTTKGVTTYGKLKLPLISYFSDLDFYLLHEWFEFFEIKVESNEGLYNEKGEKLTLQYESYKYLFVEFGKGFKKGYSEFENDLQQKTKLFEQDNKQIAFKVFSHVDTYFTKCGFSFKLNIDKKNMPLYVTPETMFNDGLEWGKQYKAWTIILDNIPVFEPLFEKYKDQPQQETNTDAPPPKKKLEFKDFFNDLDITLIDKIQSNFKDSADKDLAMLIYRLTELNLVEIIPNNKTQSRKHFVSALIGEIKKDLSFINRILQNDIKDKDNKIHDTSYFTVKTKLDNILNPKVV